MNKTILVTGGSKGIGKAIATDLLVKKYSVHIVGKDLKELEVAQKELSALGDVSISQVDLSSREEISAFVASWKSPLYGVVNNAGVCKTELLTEQNNVWDDVMSVNLEAPYLLTKGLIPFLQDNGRIVNISSQLGKEGRAGYSAYCASKFGLIGLTKCWAKELGEKGITVNAVCPGWVKTEMAMKDMERLAKEKGMSTEQYYKEICAPLELKRFTTPEEVAHVVSFLLSEEGSGVTGRDWLMNTIWNQE